MTRAEIEALRSRHDCDAACETLPLTNTALTAMNERDALQILNTINGRRADTYEAHALRLRDDLGRESDKADAYCADLRTAEARYAALTGAAQRVYDKFGKESDWTEWTDLRDALHGERSV